jgi:hypothetical protein
MSPASRQWHHHRTAAPLPLLDLPPEPRLCSTSWLMLSLNNPQM